MHSCQDIRLAKSYKDKLSIAMQNGFRHLLSSKEKS
jgi:hypothetical protein